MILTPTIAGITRKPLIPIQPIEPYAQYPFMEAPRRFLYDEASTPPSRKNSAMPNFGFAGEIAKDAAEAAADWLSQSKELRLAAVQLMNPQNGDIIEQIQALVNHTNELNELFDQAVDFLHPSLRSTIDELWQDSPTSRIGITQNLRGSWILDEARLKEAVDKWPVEVRRTLTGSSGIAVRIDQAIHEIEQLPTEALLSSTAEGFQSVTAYQATMKPYFQIEMNGVFVDSLA